jgi:hypothetical protein
MCLRGRDKRALPKAGQVASSVRGAVFGKRSRHAKAKLLKLHPLEELQRACSQPWSAPSIKADSTPRHRPRLNL